MLDCKVGKDFSLHFAARALAYYATGGGHFRVDPHTVVRRSAFHYWMMMHNTSKPNWDRQYQVDPDVLKRVLVLTFQLRPAKWIHMLESGGIRLVLEQYDAQDQQKLVNILESHYDLGHHRR